jgi:branched-chain amino acid transport system substrate-binding protein
MVPEFYSLGEEAAGTLIYAGFNPNSDNQRIKKFVSNFRNKYKRDPSRVAALSYDAYYVLAKGIETAKSLRPYHIRESLMKTKNFPGITGITSFNENREAIKEPFLLELKRKDNKFTFVSIREPL